MAMEIEKLSGEPIIINRPLPPLNAEEDSKFARQEVNRLSQYIQGTVFRIVDLTQVNITLFDMMNGMKNDVGSATREERFYIVGTDEFINSLHVAAGEQDQYGMVKNVRAFSSLEAALVAARADIAEALTASE